jgi:hypothetical protein
MVKDFPGNTKMTQIAERDAERRLYHFHKPDTEAQANEWLLRYLLRYTEQQHRSQPHSR